jgi:hypothetical protein
MGMDAVLSLRLSLVLAVVFGGCGGRVVANDTANGAPAGASSAVAPAPTGRSPNGQCPLVPAGPVSKPTGACSIVGTWSLASSHGAISSTGTIEIDADGSYYGAPAGTDLAQTYTYDGAYTVQGSYFKLSSSCGDGCTGSGTFAMTFQNDCTGATLQELGTECTGNRITVAGTVVLTRLRQPGEACTADPYVPSLRPCKPSRDVQPIFGAYPPDAIPSGKCDPSEPTCYFIGYLCSPDNVGPRSFSSCSCKGGSWCCSPILDGPCPPICAIHQGGC